MNVYLKVERYINRDDNGRDGNWFRNLILILIKKNSSAYQNSIGIKLLFHPHSG